VVHDRHACTFLLEFFIMASWEIRNVRNSVIFDNTAASVQLWSRRFKAQGYLHLMRVKEDVCSSFIQFLETIS
jgi:hypothetical protein